MGVASIISCIASVSTVVASITTGVIRPRVASTESPVSARASRVTSPARATPAAMHTLITCWGGGRQSLITSCVSGEGEGEGESEGGGEGEGAGEGESEGGGEGESVDESLPPESAGFRVQGLGFRVQGLGFRV